MLIVIITARVLTITLAISTVVALVGPSALQGTIAAQQEQADASPSPPRLDLAPILCGQGQSTVADIQPTGDDDVLLEGRWVMVPKAPIAGRFAHSVAWTGDEVLIWGGGSQRSPGGSRFRWPRDGAAFDPTAGSWRRIPAAPIQGRQGHSAVWTGTEMVIWGGMRDSRVLRDGAAYDPATNRWRTIAMPDAEGGRHGHHAVWTGNEMLVWSGLPAIDSESRDELGGLIYDPETDIWRSMALSSLGEREDDGVVWTGDRLVAVGYGAPPVAGIASYDPSTDTWSPLPPLPLDAGAWASPLWTGHEVLFVTPGRQRLDAIPEDEGVVVRNAAYVPSQDCWWLSDTVAPPNSAHFRGAWGGGLALFTGRDGMAYDPDQDRWVRMPPFEGAVREEAPSVWAGDRLFVWGGRVGESLRPKRDGLAFVPGASS